MNKKTFVVKHCQKKGVRSGDAYVLNPNFYRFAMQRPAFKQKQYQSYEQMQNQFEPRGPRTSAPVLSDPEYYNLKWFIYCSNIFNNLLKEIDIAKIKLANLTTLSEMFVISISSDEGDALDECSDEDEVTDEIEEYESNNK